MKKLLYGFLGILLLLNIAIIFSGRTYLYKAVGNTYFKGRSGPSIDEFQIFENREIKTGTPLEWSIGKDYNTKTISDSLLKQINFYKTVAFLVIKNDSVRYEKYWNNYNENSLSNSFSMAKTFVSMLVGVAITEGKIKSVDQPVADFLPEFKTKEKEKITIKHLLTMSSGIDFDENYSSPLAYPAQAYYGNDLRKITFQYDTKYEPGKNFNYLSGNTALLGFVLKSATGKEISDYTSEKLWQPMGAKNAAFWSVDKKDGDEKSYCCFNSNARDFARFGKLYLNFGKWNNQILIDSNYVAQSVIPAELLDEDGNKNEKYGYSWWLMNYKNYKIFYARGINGQYLFCIPDLNMIVVRLGHQRAKKVGHEHPKDVYIYLDAAMEM